MKASELIKLLQEVPADSEVEIVVGIDRRGDDIQTSINYDATVCHTLDKNREPKNHQVMISELVYEKPAPSTAFWAGGNDNA